MSERVTIAVPTRGRPEYLSVLISSLMSQTYEHWDLMVLPNGSESESFGGVWFDRLVELAKIGSHEVSVIPLGEIGRSPSVAYNRAQIEAKSSILLFLDDDIWVRPKYLDQMVESFLSAEEAYGRVVVSGVTPWVDRAWEGLGPNEVREPLRETEKVVELLFNDDSKDAAPEHRFVVQARQNIRYGSEQSGSPVLRPTDAISPANFMMRPSTLIPWSDVGYPMVFGDLVWSLQLTTLAGYSLFFDLRAEAVHLNASSGGLREEEGRFEKTGPGVRACAERVDRMILELREIANQRAKKS